MVPNAQCAHNHIESALQDLNLTVEVDDLKSVDYNGPLLDLKLFIGDKEYVVSSYSVYSGFTDACGE